MHYWARALSCIVSGRFSKKKKTWVDCLAEYNCKVFWTGWLLEGW